MEDYRQKFKKRYVRFLKDAHIRNLDDDAAEHIAESLAQSIDCEAYVECTDSEWCQLCADDAHVNHADGYALTDVAKKADDERPKALSEYDILPIAVPICKKCRARHRIVQTVPTLLITIIIVCALIITNYLPGVKKALFDARLFVPPTMRPFFVFMTACAVGILLGAALKRILIDSYSEKTVFNPLHIKRMSFLSEGGWHKLYQNRQYKIMFSGTKPAYMSDDKPSSPADTGDYAEVCDEEEVPADNSSAAPDNGEAADDTETLFDKPSDDE